MSYSVLAKYYDRMMGDRTRELQSIQELISRYNPNAKKVLELACGTGTFLKYLYEQGFDVTGVDLSPDMLAIAREKVPQARLLLEDIATFSITETFDTVICLFDSINHLIGYNKWEALFSRVRNRLNNGGVFIFDINTINKLERLANGRPHVHSLDGAEISMTITHRPDGAYDWLTRIEDKKLGMTEEEIIQEQSFPIAQILGSLQPLFSDVVVVDQRGQPATDSSDRIYFICLL